MNHICRDIFKAIHEGKWLSIEYRNKDDNRTKYWIGIKGLDEKRKTLLVDGLHLTKLTLCELTIFLDSILSTALIEGSYYKKNETLIQDMEWNPEKYRTVFQHTANLKILNYLIDCHRLDTTPYRCDYSLLRHFDRDCVRNGDYPLSEVQFREIIANFQYKSTRKNGMLKIKQLCVNVLSVNSKKGLYVLAYRRLFLDVSAKCLKPAQEITICREFTIEGQKQSIRQFLDAGDYGLLEDFEKNEEIIKNRITAGNPQINGVDDMPYLIALGFDNLIDLNKEYASIVDLYHKGDAAFPIKAFFGDLVKRPERRKEYPLALIDKRVNLDQLLAIHNAVKYPVTYVQGPPGTGKTHTIVNTVTTAFFNEKTVLFASYNNHPIDGVVETLQNMKYRGKTIPFPVIRLGNNDRVAEALSFIRRTYEKVKEIPVYEKTLDRNKGDKIERTKRLTALLKKHEEILDLRERKETIERLLRANRQLSFQYELQGRQLYEVDQRLKEIGEVTDEDALALLTDDEEEFFKYLYYVSVKFLKRLGEPKNHDLLAIAYMEDEEERISQFNHYIAKEENLKKFLRIFPIVATTCISAHRLGEPKPYFDLVIMDEASQCNTAVSLVPILRGENLMLVGDPQQLSPVILLDPKDNLLLRHNYSVSPEYDYIENSIYKTCLACDPVSDEILLRYHYRCHKAIIEFNNKKYYNSRLHIKSGSTAEHPLVFINVENDTTDIKNAAPAEAREVVSFARRNPDKNIGVITPFVRQKAYIEELLKLNSLNHVTCGTVHAFQGDEKDVVLFSLAITDQTWEGTYKWLKNNRELINVATSRAREQLVLLSSCENLSRLHNNDPDDDIFELAEYVRSNGEAQVTEKTAASRALGIKPYSTQTEEAFLESLNHALDNILSSGRKCVIHKEVSISHVFNGNEAYNDLFYTGRFDFVVYEKGLKELPIFAVELDGKEHFEDEVVKFRDQKKNKICRDHGFELIRVENSYARRYNYVKDILIQYFKRM